MAAASTTRFWSRVLIAGSALVLAACGNSGGDSSTGNLERCIPEEPATAEQCGSVVVALTDVEGEFTSYTVDVESIALVRADGARFETLPQPARVDFAQLTSLSEIVGTSLLDPGDYGRGRIRIDYSDAEIYLESGGNVVPADVYAADGTLLTAATPRSVVEIEFTLPEGEHLLVARGESSRLSFDFDLAASHVMDSSTLPVSAGVRPYLVAEIEPVDEKDLRVRGALADVDLDAGTYDIRLRPWLHRFGDYGGFTVTIHGDTEFEIDAQQYVGIDGLAALADRPAGTLTVAFGTLDAANRSFTADVVHAGDSLGGGRYAAVLGNIVSRAGDRLTIKGAVAIRRDRRAHFHRTVVVDVGPDTGVTKTGERFAEFDKDDLSVGQRTMILGQFTDTGFAATDRVDADVALVLDATQGHARMLTTRLSGTLQQLVPGQFNVSLRAIDRLGVGLFDFTGTGLSPELDANPADYEIGTATLTPEAVAELETIDVSSPVRVIGFITPFGAAPADFEGRLVTGPRQLPAALGVGWGIEGTAAPFSVMGAESLVIDLANPDIGGRHHMIIGDRFIDLHDLPTPPGITPSQLPRLYGISEPGHVELFKSFPDFVDELALRLSAADRARTLTAYGRYEAAANSLFANKVVVHMQPAATP